VITADLNGGTDLVYVGSEYNHSQEALMVASSIKTAADLKGKVWGTDQPGSTGDYQTKLLMRLLNINPNEVELRVLGTQDILFQALQSGQIQAAPISPPAAFQAEAAGLRVLRDTYDQPYQNVGLVVSKARIPELMPSLIAFLTGYRQGMMAYTQQPDAAKKVLQDKAKITDEATLQRTYDFYVKQTPFQLDLQPTTDGIQHMLDFVSDTIPAAKTATPEQFIDRRVLDQMPKA
jgi:NitT/TauT family transport system substrate-binding protein